MFQCNVQVEQRNAEDELNACRDHLSRSTASSACSTDCVRLCKGSSLTIDYVLVLLHAIFMLAGWLLLLSFSFVAFLFSFPFISF